MQTATDRGLVVRAQRHPGDFVVAEDEVLRAWPPDRVDEDATAALRAAFVIGAQRTPAQDVRFPLGQLTEIAALALSPGVNDLYTAMMCLDRLGEGLAFLAGRTISSPYRADADGKLRVVAKSPDLTTLLSEAFGVVRQNGVSQPLVMSRLLEALTRIAAAAHRAQDRAAVLAEAELVREAVAGATLAKADRAVVDRAFEAVMRTLALARTPARNTNGPEVAKANGVVSSV